MAAITAQFSILAIDQDRKLSGDRICSDDYNKILMKISWNPYYWLYYIIYKFIRNTTPPDKKNQVVSSSYFILTMFVILNSVGIFCFAYRNHDHSSDIYRENSMLDSRYAILLILGGFFFMNFRLFGSEEKARRIESVMEQIIILKTVQSILLFIVFFIESMSVFILGLLSKPG